ncbi:MAG: hypothetical protein IJT50_10615 [Lentisphaeria bacterium]|nr:hypothetical protein [Lentisphaeria bacterium]
MTKMALFLILDDLIVYAVKCYIDCLFLTTFAAVWAPDIIDALRGGNVR